MEFFREFIVHGEGIADFGLRIWDETIEELRNLRFKI
jgi:hypothetical protein